MNMPLPSASGPLVQAFQYACELELQALKPGNVHTHADGHGMTVQDFRVSAVVSAAPLADPGLGLGERMFAAIKATREAVACNTNLGIVLLAGPLLYALQARRPDEALRSAVTRVLESTTRKDADWAYRAIRIAAPAGLRAVPEQDVRGAPSVDLCEAMAQAAERDRIARQYSPAFGDIFDFALPCWRTLQRRWNDPAWASVGLYMELLARWPDTHVVRKYGNKTAAWLSRRAKPLAAELAKTKAPETFRDYLMDLDSELKRAGINPGTSADMTVATVLAEVLEELLSNGSRSAGGVRSHFEQLSVCC